MPGFFHLKVMKDSDRTRFESYVSVTPGCWIWNGYSMDGRYGSIKIAGKNVRAHRYSYELHVGQIPAGMVVRHSCDNGFCVNPDHLSVGTQKQNLADAKQRNRLHSKLTDRQFIEVYDLAKSGAIDKREIAALYGVSVPHVRSIANGWVTRQCQSTDAMPSS